VVVRFRAEAATDVFSARSWYEEQRVGLGNEFVTSLEHIVDLVSRHPNAFPEIASGYRRTLLPRFPYALYYRVGPQFIEVIACLHTRRLPDRWRRKR
jgi:plasmid stabilization system protein ParE